MNRLALALSLFTSMAAAAEPSNFELSWSAPSNCPNAAQIRAQVDMLLGRSAADALSSPLFVAATIRSEGEDRWVLEMAWLKGGSESTRSIRADSCVDLARAAALATALVIDPNATDNGVAFDAGSEPNGPRRLTPPALLPRGFVSRPSGIVNPRTLVSAARPIPPAWRGVGYGSLTTELGVMPYPAFGAAVGGDFAYQSFHGRVEIGTYLPQSTNVAEYTTKFWLLEIALEPCIAIGTERFQVSPCLGAMLQGYYARAKQATTENGQSPIWAWPVRAGAGLDFRYRLSPSLALDGSVWYLRSVLVERPEFRLHPEIQVFSPEISAWRAGIGGAYSLF